MIEKLKEQKKLLSSGELVHSYPHSWRSKAPLVHRATPQWFISMDSHKLRNKALLAGIVHGVVVQITISLSFNSLIFDDLTGKDA